MPRVGDLIKSNEYTTPGGFIGVAVGDLTAYIETRISSFAQASDRGIALSEYRATQRFVKQPEKIYLNAQAYVGSSRMLFLTSTSNPTWVFGGTVDAMIPLGKGITCPAHGSASRLTFFGYTARIAQVTGGLLSARCGQFADAYLVLGQSGAWHSD